MLKGIFASLVATATVGNRTLRYYISTAGGDLLWRCPNTGNIAASQSGYLRCSVADSYLTTPALGGTVNETDALPELLLTEGQVIRIWDGAAVDAAADDLTVILHYIEFDA